jgi:hypothetical protein
MQPDQLVSQYEIVLAYKADRQISKGVELVEHVVRSHEKPGLRAPLSAGVSACPRGAYGADTGNATLCRISTYYHGDL